MATSHDSPARAAAAGFLILRAIIGVGLAIDAYIHIDLAPSYARAGGVLGEQNLFLLEAGLALAAALLVLTSRRRAAAVAAAVIAASALAAVLTARYVDLGAIGPLPDLYEPVWYPQKVIAALGEATALIAAVLLLVLRPSGRNQADEDPPRSSCPTVATDRAKRAGSRGACSWRNRI